MASANPDPVEAIAMVEIAVKDIDESDLAPEDSDTERALVAKEENETHEKGKANEITVTYSTPIWLHTG